MVATVLVTTKQAANASSVTPTVLPNECTDTPTENSILRKMLCMR